MQLMYTYNIISGVFSILIAKYFLKNMYEWNKWNHLADEDAGKLQYYYHI